MADDFDDDERPRRPRIKDAWAYARNDDPNYSHEAAKRVDVTRLEGKVMSFLRQYPPTVLFTSLEIAAAVGEDKWSITPRMRPLERKEQVFRDHKRGLNSNGKERNMTGWRAALPGDYPLHRRTTGPRSSRPLEDDGFGPAVVLAAKKSEDDY